MNTIALAGCTPEPLMNYLKALGVFRLVSQQLDARARGCWRNEIFVLHTSVDEDGLVRFLGNDYQPAPLVVPWSGTDFFGVERGKVAGPFECTPTSSAVIEAFLSTSSSRLAIYRDTIEATFEAMELAGIHEKGDIEGKSNETAKARFLATLRSITPSQLLSYLDAAAVVVDAKSNFSALLGSGGGSDGNTHFSDNFMQNLWDCLPDFDGQRGYRISLSGKKWAQMISPDAIPGRMVVEKSASNIEVVSNLPEKTLVDLILAANPAWGERSAELQERLQAVRRAPRIPTDAIKHALFGNPTQSLIQQRTSALYDAGAVGGVNAGQGFERKSLTNPWNFILGLEGTLAFAGGIAKRWAATAAAHATFPFQFRLTSTGLDSTTFSEEAGREVWLPQWSHPATCADVTQLLAEGRAEISGRPARDGVDMVRAVASLGVDRGIRSFRRYAIVRGRVGGENYNTAASLGKFDVSRREGSHLLEETGRWLDSLRSRCHGAKDGEAPARFTSALRRIDAGIFSYCRYGGAS